MGLLSTIASKAKSTLQNAAKSGSTLVNNVTKAAQNTAKKVQQNVQKTANNVQKNVQKTVSNAQKQVQNTAKNVQTNVGKATSTLQKNVSTAAKKTAEAVKANPTKALAVAAMPAAGLGIVTSSLVAPNLLSSAQNTVNNAAQTISSGVSGIGASVSNAISTVVSTRDASYDQAFKDAESGNIAGGVARGAVTAAADTLLPLDALNVGNKLITGQSISGEEWLYAGVDAVAAVAGALSGGLGYVGIKAGAKAIKTGVKAGGTSMGLLKFAKKVSTAKSTSASKKHYNNLVRTQEKRLQAAQAANNANKIAAAQRGLAAAKTQKNAYLNTLKQTKQASTLAKASSGGSTVTKAAKASNTGSTLTKATKSTAKTALIGGGIGAALVGIPTIISGVTGAIDNSYNSGYEDGYAEGSSLWDTGIGDMGLGDMGLGDMGLDEGLYDDSGFLEDAGTWADGVMEDISDVPVVGSLAEQIQANGLSLPVLVLGAIVICAGGYFLIKKFSKKGKKTGTKKRKSTAKKTTKGGVAA